MSNGAASYAERATRSICRCDRIEQEYEALQETLAALRSPAA